ncbi:D-xylose-proton symporter-like 2 [Drosophila innubila]|uniref:D-xylose-proton symporter-like 2 n=1 Tax=Drosophila innubila TaxID=198719 RepID=UPI00148D9A1F|nr:D-xylose-proton symporter-like 2 [Drosophila innubila]
MTPAYENSEKLPPTQIMYAIPEKLPPIQYANQNQSAYIATAPPNPPQTTYVTVINNSMPRRTRWQQRRSNTIVSAMFVFIYGGMDMAQGLGWNIEPATYEFQYSWFVGVIIGAVLAALSVTHVPKWVFYSLGALLQLIDGILFTSAASNYNAILAARYIGGTGIGLYTVSYIIHNSEITTSKNRGIFSGIEQYALALGIALQVIFTEEWSLNLNSGLNLAHGICGIVFSLLAMGFVAFTGESPIFHLRKNNEEKARSCQLCYVNISAPANAFNGVFDEAKRYVAEGNSMSIGAELSSSAMPFIKMLFCRCLVAFTFSVPLSMAILESTMILESYLDWTVIVWGILRWIGACITLAIVDRVGRKFTSVLGLLCMAALMLAMAGIFANGYNQINVYYMTQVYRISIAFQFFAGIYVPCTSIYLGEAFPMRVKPYLIGLIICIQQAIHIIVIFYQPLYLYFLAVGIILVISMLLFVVLMPETRGLTLRQAGHRFRRVHDVTAY